MKIRFAVEFDVENDWDDSLTVSLGIGDGSGRKKVVGSFLRRATMLAVMDRVAPLMVGNGIVVSAVRVSDPEWAGWDNARIAAELVAEEGAADGGDAE